MKTNGQIPGSLSHRPSTMIFIGCKQARPSPTGTKETHVSRNGGSKPTVCPIETNSNTSRRTDMTTAATARPIIQRYFELAPSRDTEEYFALFADDALVEDEGKEYRGIESIRAWRTEVPLVVYTITSIEPVGENVIVTCTVTGDFPGSPFAGLKFHFEQFDADQVKVLRIRT
ncbi:nuclear transport factor 2 family protein [Streptomyces sp. NPDC047453]|uniref:nuclear transport factor 2 family protein n=1 Tax=Streptomyces sp. NPDC047453 TaxID=3154812 RepID=UPI0033E06C7C